MGQFVRERGSTGGIIAWPKEVGEKFGKGEVVTAADGYFLTAPRFTTTSPNYAWLNHLSGGREDGDGPERNKIVYDIFAVR
jgi:hypothetical protein